MKQKEGRNTFIRILIWLVCYFPFNTAATAQEDSLTLVLENHFLKHEYNKITDNLNMYYDVSGNQKIKISKRLLSNSKSPIDILYSSLYLGVCYYQIGEIDTALLIMNKAMLHINDDKLPELSSDFNVFLGKIYSQQGNFDLAEEKTIRSIELAEQARVESKVTRGKVELGNILFALGRTDEALLLFNSAERFFQKEKNIANTQIVRTYIALCLLNKNEFDNALQIFQEIDSVTLHNNLIMIRAAALTNESSLYLETKSFDNAIKKAREGFLLCSEIKDEYAMIGNQRIMTDAFLAKGKYDSAFYHLKIADSISNKLYNDNYLKTIEELETNYEIQQSHHELSLIEKEKLIEARRYERNVYIFVSVLVGLLLILLIVFLWFQKQKLNAQRNLQNEQIKSNEVRHNLDIARQELLAFKSLTTEKDQLISEFLIELDRVREHDVEAKRKELEKMLILTKEDTMNFKALFDSAYPGFLKYLISIKSNLSPNDIILIILIFLDIKSKVQSNMLGISMESLRKARYRLKKKIIADDSQFTNIDEYIESIYHNYVQSSLIKRADQ